MAEERSEEVVPGLAEAIERRRLELGLTLGEFVDRTGITRAGLTPLRKGYRRQYQDKLKLGVARALRWEPDAIDKLFAGQVPTPATTAPDDPTDPGGLAAKVDRLEEKVDELSGLLRAALSGDASKLFLDENEPDSTRPRPPPMTGDEGT